jgi:hypothetical protein
MDKVTITFTVNEPLTPDEQCDIFDCISQYGNDITLIMADMDKDKED